ncbi:hypothetical protein Aperf_G00000001163 [Anoplocephala perfoliata]
MQRSQMHIGAFLRLLPSKLLTNMEIFLDISLTIMNREHFSKNQHFTERQVVFNRETRRHGCETLIELSDLSGGKYLSDESTFLLELELLNLKLNIFAQLSSTSELVRFLCNTYVDRYNAEDSEHSPILFESKAFSAGGEMWCIGVAMSHASIFGPEEGGKKVRMYMFRRKGKDQNAEKNHSFIEFSCEIESQTTYHRMHFVLDPQSGMSCMQDLSQEEANAVTDFVQKAIADHIAKKVPFKYFNPILEVKLNSLRVRRLTPRRLILLSPESRLYFSTLPFDPANMRWNIYAYPNGNTLNCALQSGSEEDGPTLTSNSIDLIWWSAHSGNGGVENGDIFHETPVVGLSIATSFQQMQGTEMNMNLLNGAIDFENTLSPSQCSINYRKGSLDDLQVRIHIQ